MKAISTFYIFVLSCIGTLTQIQLHAQTNVVISTHNESVYPTCTVPTTGYFYCEAKTTNYTIADSVRFFIDFGDSHDTTVTLAQNFYTSTLATTSPSSITHTYVADGNYPVKYITTMPDGKADTVALEIMVTSTCNNVTGQVYVDMNSNCVFDGGDFAMPYYGVSLDYNNSRVAGSSTDGNGFFTLSAATGFTYNLIAGDGNDPALVLACSSSQGMPITPSPALSQDLIGTNTTTVHIDFAGDSATSYSGNCVPLLVHNYVHGATFGYSAPNDSLTMYINFGDGQDSTITSAITGPIGYFGFGGPHTYTAPGNYNLLYRVTASDGRRDTVVRYNQVVVTDTCGNVQGNLYYDNNNNCINDAGDSAVRWMYVGITNLSTGWTNYSYTDFQGHYSFNVAPGNYSVQINPHVINYFSITPTCPASGSSTVTVTASNSVTSDFALVCPSSHNLSAGIGIRYGIFPNYTSHLYADVTNLSCTAIPGSVKLILDPLTHYMGVCDTSLAPTVNGDTLTWNFSTVNNYSSWYYWFFKERCIEIRGDASLQLGDTVCYTMIVNPIAGDLDPLNNTLTKCFPALVAWDPNIKEVSPEGSGPLGYVPEGTKFDYKINFQNTGTASARNIFVLDTLDADLDLSTLVITGSDHYMEPQLLPGNILRFNFPDINLADSTSDEPHSHGWVTYSINAKVFLPNLTPIQNKAGIYFDFNPPVITNSTLNTIYDPSSVTEISNSNTINIFPVPADQSLQVNVTGNLSSLISICDMTGRIVRTEKISGTTGTVFVGDLAEGIYMVTVKSDGNSLTKKVVIQH